MGCSVSASPFLPPSSADKPGAVGEDCLRPKGPSSAAARLGEQRREPVAKRRAVERGRLFFGYLLLAKQKKEPAAGLPPAIKHSREAQQIRSGM